MATTTRQEVTEAKAFDAIWLARQHEGEGRMSSSAKLAADDAAKCFERGWFGYAVERACTSLAYSVGVFHPDYQRAVRA